MIDMSGSLLATSQVLTPLRSHPSGPRMTDLSSQFQSCMSPFTISMINAIYSLTFLPFLDLFSLAPLLLLS